MAKPRITVLHNSKAGFKEFSPKKVEKFLQRRGYEVISKDLQEDNYAASFKEPGSAVIIAGGDGTIGKTARELLGKELKIGILPFGTANNIGATLHIKGKPEEILARYDLTRTRGFDLGAIINDDKEDVFFESVGFGIFTELMHRKKGKKKKATRKQELADARKELLNVVKTCESHVCTLFLEDEQISGDFIMVEIMNIPVIGPSIWLSQNAIPDDGWLDVIMVRESEREPYVRHLTACIKDNKVCTAWPIHRVKAVKIDWQGKQYHRDDTICPMPDKPLSLIIKPKALTFL